MGLWIPPLIQRQTLPTPSTRSRSKKIIESWSELRFSSLRLAVWGSIVWAGSIPTAVGTLTLGAVLGLENDGNIRVGGNFTGIGLQNTGTASTNGFSIPYTFVLRNYLARLFGSWQSPPLLKPALVAGKFTVFLPTISGQRYRWEFK